MPPIIPLRPGTVVARLLAPMPARGIEITVRGLETQYGNGLTWSGEIDRAGVEWWVFRTPVTQLKPRSAGLDVSDQFGVLGYLRTELAHLAQISEARISANTGYTMPETRELLSILGQDGFIVWHLNDAGEAYVERLTGKGERLLEPGA